MKRNDNEGASLAVALLGALSHQEQMGLIVRFHSSSLRGRGTTIADGTRRLG